MCLESYLDKKLTFPWVHFPWNEMNKNKKKWGKNYQWVPEEKSEQHWGCTEEAETDD